MKHVADGGPRSVEFITRNLSELDRTRRLDAEFFRREALEVEAQLKSICTEPLTQVADISDGNHFSISESFVDDGGLPYYRGQDVVGHFFIEQASPQLITREAYDHAYMRRSHLQQGDVLLSIVGTVGETSLVKTSIEATCSCKLAILLPTNVDPAYLAAYLSSQHGRTLVRRWKRGAVQTGLLLEDMDQLPVPRFTKTFESLVSAAVGLAYHALEESSRLFKGADATFARNVGLASWAPPAASVYIARSSSVISAGRLDAEHFQHKFFAAKQAILKAGAIEFVPINALINVLTNGHTPLRHDLKEGDVPFLCAEHVDDFNVNYASKKRILSMQHGGELARTAVKDGDLLLTIKGRVGNAAIATTVPGPININQDVALMRLNDELPTWYVASYLNSVFGKLQTEQFATGGINPFLGLSNIRQFTIPRFPRLQIDAIAYETMSNVAVARESRERAERLLSAAKEAIDISIAQTEAAGMDFLQARL